MNRTLIASVLFTGLVVVACGRGCEKVPVIPDDETPTQKPTAPTAKPTLEPTPTATPTMEIKTFVVPEKVQVSEEFVVRAYVSGMEIVEVYADNFRLGYMGWDSVCLCKKLSIKLNTAGERSIRFLSGNREVASEIILVEAE